MNRPNHGGNLIWAATLAGCPPSFILDFSASINPLGPPQFLLKAIQENLGAIAHYPDPSYQQLCLALAQEHQVPPDHVLPGNGAAELITWAARELAELDWVGMVTPAFSDYQRSLSAFHAKIKEFPLELPALMVASFDPPQPPFKRGENQLSPPFVGVACPEDLGGFRGILPIERDNSYFCVHGNPQKRGVRLFDLPRGDERAGLLLNNPHNPTGKLWRREEILPYLEEFALVVLDEAFMDFLSPKEEQSLIPLVQDYPNLVIIRSLTKFYSMPGLRLGYAIAHPARLQRWQQWRDPWSVNVLAEAAGLAALEDREFRQQTWNWLAPTRAKLWQDLEHIPGLYPYLGAANFLLVHSQQSVLQLQEKLLRRDRVLIRDCVSFAELGDRYFRVAVRTEAENQRLVEGLTNLVVPKN